MTSGERPRAAEGSGEGRGGAPPLALGSDPFADAGGHDPLDDWLDALDRLAEGASRRADAAPGSRRGPRPEAPATAATRGVAPPASARPASAPPGPDAAIAPERPAPRPPPRADTRRRVRRPGPTEIPLAPADRRLARLVGEDAARRLAALVADREPWDRFGLSPAALRRAFPVFYALYRHWFRVRSEGHGRVPARGPVLLVANHGGLLPFDGAMTIVDLLLHGDPPRLPRALVDRWVGGLPWVNVFFARVGQVIATRENIARLLADEEAVLVFPEGIDGIRKPITQRYRLQPFRSGFVRHALRARAPIVPVAILGSDDQAPILFDVKPLARALGLPTAPITPTFPWLGPLGLLPYPVRYRIVYGEPIALHERVEPGAADDPERVRALAADVRRVVQGLIDRHRR